MELNEYQKLAARTINPALDMEDQTGHALMGMAAEVGELCGLYQKQYQGHSIMKEHAVKEAGDILWMLAEWCTANCITMDEVAQTNIDKLRARYPDGFEQEKSLHRAEGDV